MAKEKVVKAIDAVRKADSTTTEKIQSELGKAARVSTGQDAEGRPVERSTWRGSS